ncbi:MAG: hypothetical protein KGR98_06985 [Verrucomicrobia bacterium]|nr:hypothetical protein [Verrucomicrobiota bacterium]MDE3098662.1 hypothetical protein [Verrucomicrobiota bacterium]
MTQAVVLPRSVRASPFASKVDEKLLVAALESRNGAGRFGARLNLLR